MSKKHQHLAASGSIWKHLGASGSFWEHLGASGSIWEPLGASGSIWAHLGASGSLHFSGCLLFWKSVRKFAQTSGSIWDHLGASGSLHFSGCFLFWKSAKHKLLKLLGAFGIIWESTFFWLPFILEVCHKPRSNFWEHLGASGSLHFSGCLLFWKSARKKYQTSGSIWEHLGIYMFLVAFYFGSLP